MNKTLAKHLAAIESSTVTRTNVIGLRKAFNAAERLRHGYTVSATCPAPSQSDMYEVISALAKHHPTVTGELHDTGIALLSNPRDREQLSRVQWIIENKIHRFELLRFDPIGGSLLHYVPVYRAISKDFTNREFQGFDFRNIPWQSGGKGPEILEN